MTVLNFPASPAVNDTYTENNVTYTWNGNYWEANNTGSLDDIYVEVAGDVMTGNLQLPGGGGNTAALQKQEITDLPVSTFDNDSGYITSSDIPPGTVSYWKKDGSDLKPVTDTDNVNIGDGNITLNTDGRIYSQRYYSGDSGTGGTGTYIDELAHTISKNTVVGSSRSFSVVDSTGVNLIITHEGDVSIGGTLPSDPNITLNADGSAEFAGNISLSDWYMVTAKTNPGTGFIVNGTEKIAGISNGNAANPVSIDCVADGKIIIHQTNRINPNITFNASGSASFSGAVSINDVVTASGHFLGAGGGAEHMALAAAVDSTPVLSVGKGYIANFQVTAGGTLGIGGTLPSAPNITLTTGGEIYLKKYGGIFMNGPSNYDYGVFMGKNLNNGKEFLGLNAGRAPGASSATSRMLIDGELGDVRIGGILPSTPNITLNADGTAYFKDQVDAEGDFVSRNSADPTNDWCYLSNRGLVFNSGQVDVVNTLGTGVSIASGQTAWTAVSQRSLKTDLQPIVFGLEKVATLSAITGRYKTDEDGTSRSFLIADEVKEVLPEAVSGSGTEEDPLSLRYTEVIPLLVSALHDAKDRIEELEARLDAAGV